MAASGYGNFIEIGPYNMHMKPRKHTWIKDFNILFVDSPIGTGFSYFSEKNGSLLTSTIDIGRDLVSFLKKFLETHKEFQTMPLYIFGESYGGKMAAEFAYQLEKVLLSSGCFVLGLFPHNTLLGLSRKITFFRI